MANLEEDRGLLSTRRGSLEDKEMNVDDEDALCLRVKTSGDDREYKVKVKPDISIGKFKKEVAKVIGAEGKYLRLIIAGKMLLPDEAPVQDFKVTNNSFVHCVVTAAPPQQQLPSPPDNEQQEEEEEDDATNPRRGFDALRGRGVSRAAVTALRAYFSSDVREFSANLLAPEREGQSDWDRQMDSEERWMATQGATSEFALNLRGAQQEGDIGGTGANGGLFQGGRLLGLDRAGEGDDGSSGGTRDFLFGFALGSFLGLIMLLWMWEPSTPRKQKLGILAGVIFKLGRSLLRRPDAEDAEGE